MSDQHDDSRNDAPQQKEDRRNEGGRQPDLIGYSVKDRGPDKDAAWNRVGAAWMHRDGKGMELLLDATPVDGKVTLREQRREEFKENRRAQSDQNREHDRNR